MNDTGKTGVAHNNECQFCGWVHDGGCLRLKAVEYYKDGTIKRYELFEPKSHNENSIF